MTDRHRLQTLIPGLVTGFLMLALSGLRAAEPADGGEGLPVDPDVRGYWCFDGEPEAGLPDKSGQGNDGTVHGQVRRVEGRHSGAFRFNGTDTWVEVPFSPTLTPKQGMIIEMWLRPKAVDERQTVIGRYQETNDRRSFRLSVQGGQVIFEYSGRGSTDYLGKGGGLRSEQRMVAGQWNHVALSFDGRFFGFLINGRSDRAFVGLPNPWHPSVPRIYQAESPLQIGRHFDGREGRHYYRGDIDSVKITMPEFPIARTESVWERTPLAENALNNLVRLLLEKAPPAAGAYEFANPAGGWVFFAATGLAGTGVQARLRLEGGGGEIVLEAGNRWEAMRRLAAGRYRVTLTLTGGDRVPDRLSIRRVPELLYTKYAGTPDWEFLKRHVLHSVNLCVSRAEILSRIRRLDDPLPIVPRPPLNHRVIDEVVEWVNSGREWLIQRTSLRSPWLGLTFRDAYRKWRPSYVAPYSGTIIDEIASNLDHEQLQHYTAVINRLKHEFPDKHTYIWAAGFEQCSTNNIFFNALFENGGRVVYERYLATQSTQQIAGEQIHRMFVEPMRQACWPFPGIQRNMIWSPSTWSGPHVTEDVLSDVDYKVFLDMQFHTLATHPVFRDLAGIAPWSADLADREINRWLGALYRHYGIEGRTDRLAERYGYSYKLDHLTNPGFEKGMEGLDVVTAEPGSVGAGDVTDDMRPATYRVGPRGQKYLWMQRSERAPNRVRLQVAQLRPGGHYAVKLYTADLGDMATVLKAPHVISIRVRGGKTVEEESDRGVGRSSFARGGKPFSFSHFFVAFLAAGETAEVEISDWANEQDPGGPVGQRLLVDFLQVKPLFMGVDEQTGN